MHNPKIIISNHAYRRARSRFHINEQELKLLAVEAYKNGTKLKNNKCSLANIEFTFVKRFSQEVLVTVHPITVFTRAKRINNIKFIE